jgi:hypothetical protein
LIFRRARPPRLSVLQPGRRAIRRRRPSWLMGALFSLALLGAVVLLMVAWPLG